MYKLKNNESDINSDDCNETSQECIYRFSSPKKQKSNTLKNSKKIEQTYSISNFEKWEVVSTNMNNEKNTKRKASNTNLKNSSQIQVNFAGLKKNEQDYVQQKRSFEKLHESEGERETNDNYIEESDYDEEGDYNERIGYEDQVSYDTQISNNETDRYCEYNERKKCQASRGDNVNNLGSIREKEHMLGEMDEKMHMSAKMDEKMHMSAKMDENVTSSVELDENVNSSDELDENVNSSDELDENVNSSDELDEYNSLYDEELNEMIGEGHFKELIPAIPHDILNSYIACLKTCGFEREVQLHRLINLLGDLRDPISVIQVLGLPGMGKTKVVKNFIKLMNVPFAYVNCLMAVYQSGRSAKNVIFHTILKDLSINLLKEFNEYKKVNNIMNCSYDPTKLVPTSVSNTDNFFNILHKLLSFRPDDEQGLEKIASKKKKKGAAVGEASGEENNGGRINSPVNGNNAEEKENKKKCRNNKNHYYKDKLYDRSVVFILDNIRYLVRTHPDLFYALTRIHEYIKGPYADVTKANKITRGLCVILINRSPLPDEIFDGLPQPPTVWFDSYTADMCKNILYRLYETMCFESLLTYNDKDLKIFYVKDNKKEFLIKKKNVILNNDVIYDIWCRYIDYIVNVSYKDYKSDFHELLFICSHMWPLFIRPIIEGSLEPIVENMNALQRNIDTHIRVATYNHASHFTFELIDSVFLNESNLKNKIDLSFYSKILLVGAYLASRNLPITDKRFFNATVKGGAFSLPKKRKTRNKNESILTLIGQAIPKNFTFIRWLCLTDCLLVCFFDEQLILNSLICHQINTLIQLGFITFSSSNNLSCLVRNSLMNGVQWSGYCGSALLNSTNNFSSPNNNIFSETTNSMAYESLDPYSKLVIHVPEETIRSISKEMKIPLDELIL
ncbi:origin recognition complex subunit 5 [Plasmodium brasilianum]|uniref:Origin recognition complex subunit 5, putative n=2 Tax=Plasmodium (Plasmodium) TaxID=418103 RepID=A0A1A8VRG8_PLAMA|nr:origin recognition complex subunit 5, putative [Plasmodium malariae]KAI4840382.1 origin recognition complex subunit 5 [Plasmodium brasilianum]SBS82272.1 origin recognition complex subunit 5, putative [Plasmodium malariae]SBT86471.1 origin recognition complex subunit 5, putative [Plasmodium malariae]